MRIFFSLLFIYCFLHIQSQTGTQPAFQNYAIAQHYDSLELATIQQTDTAKFSAICYYYMQSYIFETAECNCTPPSATTFDVSQYEYLRKKNVRSERYFEKYGFKLTLLSVNEMPYRLPIHNP
jgi:hypothetical protein